MMFYEALVSTPEEMARRKLTFAQIQPNEIVYDLGCGGGEVLKICAEEFGAQCVGIEVRPKLAELARAAGVGLEKRFEVRCENFMESDISEADVLVLYLTRNTLGQLSLKLENELKLGARIVTHTFDLPAWAAEEAIQWTDSKGEAHDLYLYRQKERLPGGIVEGNPIG